jgi:acyl-CoA thioesterase-1
MTVEIARGRWRGLRRLALTLTFAPAALLLTPAPGHADPIRIVAIGDSNLDPPGLEPELMYPPKLEAALRAKGHDVVVTNAGHRGDKTADVVRRLDDDVPAGTDIALAAVGVNDLADHLGGGGAIAKNLTNIVFRLRKRGIEVLLFGIGSLQKPTCCRGAKLAEKAGALFYRNFQDGVVDDPKLHIEKQRPAPGSSLLNGSQTANAWHLNAAGNDIVVARTLPLVEQLIERVNSRRQ